MSKDFGTVAEGNIALRLLPVPAAPGSIHGVRKVCRDLTTADIAIRSLIGCSNYEVLANLWQAKLVLQTPEKKFGTVVMSLMHLQFHHFFLSAGPKSNNAHFSIVLVF